MSSRVTNNDLKSFRFVKILGTSRNLNCMLYILYMYWYSYIQLFTIFHWWWKLFKKTSTRERYDSRPAWSKENKHCTILNTFKLGCFPCRLTCFWSILLSCKHCCTNRIDTHKTLSTLQVGPELYNHIYISQYEISTTPWNAILRSKTPSRLKQRFCFLCSLSSQRVSAHCATVPSSLQRTQIKIQWFFLNRLKWSLFVLYKSMEISPLNWHLQSVKHRQIEAAWWATRQGGLGFGGLLGRYFFSPFWATHESYNPAASKGVSCMKTCFGSSNLMDNDGKTKVE